MDWTAQIEALGDMSARAADAGESAPDADVEHCPGWSAADLMVHLAQVQWFWSDVCERTVTAGDDVVRPPPPPDGVAAQDWLRRQSVRLVEALAPLDPDSRLWTWFDADQTARFVLRRQTIEAAIHCFDAELAAGVEWTASPEIVELGLAEFVDVMQTDRRDGVALAPLHLEPVDSSWRGTLFAESSGEPVRLARSAAETLLALWGRHRVSPDAARLIAAVDLD